MLTKKLEHNTGQEKAKLNNECGLKVEDVEDDPYNGNANQYSVAPGAEYQCLDRLCKAEQKQVELYQRMLKARVPYPAVVNRMKLDKASVGVVAAVNDPKEKKKTMANSESSPTAVPDADYYSRKSEAVRILNEMLTKKLEHNTGQEKAKLNNECGLKVEDVEDDPYNGNANQYSVAPGAEYQCLDRLCKAEQKQVELYQRMLKARVPYPAVVNRMKLDKASVGVVAAVNEPKEDNNSKQRKQADKPDTIGQTLGGRITLMTRLGDVYRDPHRVERDASTLLHSRVGCNLNAVIAAFDTTNGLKTAALCLNGTIQISFKGKEFHQLMDIFLGPSYPSRPPVCYVRIPSSDMFLKKNHPYVGSDGQVFLPYLSDWRPSSHSLIELLVVMSSVFSADPPVFMRTSAALSFKVNTNESITNAESRQQWQQKCDGNLSEKERKRVAIYQQMLKAGVPYSAVIHKMELDKAAAGVIAATFHTAGPYDASVKVDKPGSKPEPADATHNSFPWRSSIPDSSVDPITLEPLDSLPYPPFAISNDAPFAIVAEWPTLERTRINGPQRRSLYSPSSPDQNVTLYDGRALAYYMVSKLQFKDPMSQRSLTREEIKNLDNYLDKHGFRQPDLLVVQAYDDKILLSSSSPSSAAAIIAKNRLQAVQGLAVKLFHVLMSDEEKTSSESKGNGEDFKKKTRTDADDVQQETRDSRNVRSGKETKTKSSSADSDRVSLSKEFHVSNLHSLSYYDIFQDGKAVTREQIRNERIRRGYCTECPAEPKRIRGGKCLHCHPELEKPSTSISRMSSERMLCHAVTAAPKSAVAKQGKVTVADCHVVAETLHRNKFVVSCQNCTNEDTITFHSPEFHCSNCNSNLSITKGMCHLSPGSEMKVSQVPGLSNAKERSKQEKESIPQENNSFNDHLTSMFDKCTPSTIEFSKHNDQTITPSSSTITKWADHLSQLQELGFYNIQNNVEVLEILEHWSICNLSVQKNINKIDDNPTMNLVSVARAVELLDGLV